MENAKVNIFAVNHIHNNDMRIRIYVHYLTEEISGAKYIRREFECKRDAKEADRRCWNRKISDTLSTAFTLHVRHITNTLHSREALLHNNNREKHEATWKYDSTIHRDASRDRLTRILTENNMASLELSKSYRCLCSKWSKRVNIKQYISMA